MKITNFFKNLKGKSNIKWLTLGDICTIKTGPNINKKIIANQPGPYPVINSGKEPLGYHSQFNVENDPIGIASRGSVGLVTWTEGKFFRGNLNYSCSPKKNTNINRRYLYHYLLEADVSIQSLATHEGIPALNAGALKTLPVPVPFPDDPEKSLAIQTEIVRILDSFTQLTAELTAELTARKKQYDYYRSQLLSLKSIGSIKWTKLKNVAQYSKERIEAKHLNSENYIGVDNLLQNRAGKVPSNHAPTSGKVSQFKTDDILIGNIRPYLRKIWQADTTGGASGDVLIINPTDNTILPRYLYQILADENFFVYNIKHSKGAKMPRGNKQKIMEFEFPIPYPDDPEKSLAIQAEIVRILDKFDKLTTSLSEGLPREIELRQKQYEYYRNLLFSFPKDTQP
jgi:type I restriction enzyme S subunit